MHPWLDALLRGYRHVEPIADAAFNVVLLLFLGYLWLMKGLLLGRSTPLSLWLARSKIAQAANVVAAALTVWIAFFGQDVWRWPSRLLVAFCCWRVLIELSRAFGGWWAMHRRAFLSGVSWIRREPEPEEPRLDR